jgi:hypothetical protein
VGVTEAEIGIKGMKVETSQRGSQKGKEKSQEGKKENNGE